MMESKSGNRAIGDDGESSHISAPPLSIHEARLNRPSDEGSGSRTRLVSYETQSRRLAELLSEAQAQLANKRELLHWIVNSRSWKLTSWLRQLNFLSQRLRPGFLRSSLDDFIGSLEKPSENGVVVAGHLEVSGWVYAKAASIASVEAFLDNVPVGMLRHGQARPDVASYPSQAPLNCGYGGVLLIDESFRGRRTLAVRVTDKRGHIKDYTQTITIEDSAPQTLLSGLELAHMADRPSDEAMNPLLRDDLLTAKRLLTTTSMIALRSLLINGSTLEFPRTENPATSIILVLYNRAELTLQCLYSILKSNLRSYEIIIFDNASTDETGQLLKRIKGARIIESERNLHYLLACNKASRRATGEYLLLLNNDAQIQGDSLSSALETLNSSADIGAVGGKLILPDGTVQEAGSIIWRDGSCQGYGRGDSPFAPPYMFKRDVDYCSAAFLLTRRELFLAGGGFDEAYVPAYYEETDYCVRLWKQGKRVVYDPKVTILHYEFASSESSRSATDLQASHRKIFVARHRDWLPAQHSSSSSEGVLASRMRQPPGAKRILYLDDRIPHLTLGSGFPRSNRIILELVRMGHFVTCYPLEFPQEDWTSVYQDMPLEVEAMIGHGLPLLERFLAERAGYYQLIFVSRPHNMATLKALCKRSPALCSGADIIYDAEALFSLREIDRLRLMEKRISPEEQQRMMDEEIKLAEGCHRILSVSERESREFIRRGFERVHVLGHALTPSPTANDFDERRDILFVGAMHDAQSPNADSVLWFSKNILPKIQQKLGNRVHLILAGPIHPGVEEKLAGGCVRIEGEVKDLTGLYNRARIFIAPTRFSAGIPYKIHEAAAHGLPVVATSFLGSQLGWNDEEELLLAYDEESFARACVRLYEDREFWNGLRQRALTRVARDCSPEIFSEQLRAIIE